MLDLLALHNDRKVKVLIVDISDASAAQKAQWLGGELGLGAHVVANFALTELMTLDEPQNFTRSSSQLSSLVEDYESRLNLNRATTNWALGGQDKSRLATAYPVHHEHLTILSMMSPGTNIFYYGAEIGMTDNLNIPIESENDFRRFRTPFHWDDSKHAGFSNTSGQTWLPVNPQYANVNLKAQENDDNSIFKMYQQLIELRQQKEVLRIGRVYVQYSRVNEVIAAERRSENYASILTFINLENNVVTTSLWDVLQRYYYPTKTTADVLFTRGSTSLVFGEPIENVEGNFELGPYATVIIRVNSATKMLTSLSLLLLSFVSFLINN